MDYLLTDFDGVLLRTEFAKAAGWYIAALHMNREVSKDLFEELKNEDESIIENVKNICETNPNDFKKVTDLAGKSRNDTRDGVWNAFLSDCSEYNRDDLEKKRGEIKDSLQYHMAQRINGNISFFQEAKEGGLEIGLISQAKAEEIRKLSERYDLDIDNLFSRVECSGDSFYKEMDKKNNYKESINKKAVAYAILCKSFGINPWETFSVEDSASGVEATNAVGVPCLGVKDEHNKQDLFKATLVVSPDLGELANQEVITFVKEHDSKETILYLNDYLSGGVS